MSLAAVASSSRRQTAQGIDGVGALVWGWCLGRLGADHITKAVERDMPPQRFVCGLMPQALHRYGMPLTAVVMWQEKNSVNYEEFNQFCRSMPVATHVVQWGGSDVWKVGGKVFAIGGWGDNDEPAYVFKTSDQNFAFLCEYEGYRPAPYFANRGMKWIQQVDSSEGKDDDLRYYIRESHRLVSLGLTKKKQRELGLNQEEGL